MGGPLCDQISEVNAAEADEGAVLEVGDPSFQMGTAALISWGSSLETPVLVEGGDKDLGAFWAALPEEHSWGSEESCTVADAPCVHDDAAAQASASLVHPDSRHDLGPVVCLGHNDTPLLPPIHHHATSSSNVVDNARQRRVVEESWTVADDPCVHAAALHGVSQASISHVQQDSGHDLGPVVILGNNDTQHHGTHLSNEDVDVRPRLLVEAAALDEYSWGTEESWSAANDEAAMAMPGDSEASASLWYQDFQHDLGPVVSLGHNEAPSMPPTLHHATLSSKVDEKARPRPRREVEEPAPHGFARVQGLLVRKSQLPSRWEETLENNMEQLRQRSELLATLSSQQVLRLVLSADLDVDVAAQSFERTLTWRRENCMEVERARVRAQIHSIGDDTPVRFPYHNEVCRKLMAVSPCALVTEDGQPVTFYHIGTSNTKEVASLDPDHVVEFGRGILEYVDEWVQQHSDRTGQLLGHVLVFDLGGLSWSQLWCKDIHEKLKASLGMGGYYVEVVAHIYVLNTSALFSSVWKLVKQLIPARTSTKITVANGLAPELVERFSPRSVERLKRILSGAGKGPPPEVLRPPVGP